MNEFSLAELAILMKSACQELKESVSRDAQEELRETITWFKQEFDALREEARRQ